jgi:uncharacterized protein (TIGR02284 family)
MALETKCDLEADTIEALQDLIQTNLDARDGFRFAADELENAAIAATFEHFADQRQQQADELTSFVECNGDAPRREGSYSAAVHRTWMKVRELITTNDTDAILSEAERGEDHIKGAYETTLRKTAGSAVNDVLTRQYAQVKAAHDRVKMLRDECHEIPS